MNVTLNVQKANWNNFVKNLQSNYETAKLKMKVLIQTPNIENMKKMVILLRSTIENAIHENISKRRSCNQSKVWWSKNLIDRRKIITYSKRQWKNSRLESDWDLFDWLIEFISRCDIYLSRPHAVAAMESICSRKSLWAIKTYCPLERAFVPPFFILRRE